MPPDQKFKLGRILATPAAVELGESLPVGESLLKYLFRHSRGDWGDLDDQDKKENDLALEKGFRILSAYETSAGRLWIITERDRSATTFLLPSDY